MSDMPCGPEGPYEGDAPCRFNDRTGLAGVQSAARVLLGSAEFQHAIIAHRAGLDEVIAALRSIADGGR